MWTAETYQDSSQVGAGGWAFNVGPWAQKNGVQARGWVVLGQQVGDGSGESAAATAHFQDVFRHD